MRETSKSRWKSSVKWFKTSVIPTIRHRRNVIFSRIVRGSSSSIREVSSRGFVSSIRGERRVRMDVSWKVN